MLVLANCTPRTTPCFSHLPKRKHRVACYLPKRLVQRRFAAAEKSSSLGETVSEKQQRVETNAAEVFTQHLEATSNSDQSAQEVAFNLLQQVTTTRKVQPELALGAALAVEREADCAAGTPNIEDSPVTSRLLAKAVGILQTFPRL